MKKIFLTVFILFTTILLATDYNILFNKPAITSDYHYSILQKEREDTIIPIKKYKKDRYFYGEKLSIFTYKNKDLYMFVNYKLGLAYNVLNEVNYYQYIYGATFKGNIKDRLLMYSDWWKVQFSKKVNELNSPLQDSWNEEKSIDNSNTIIKYRGDFWDFSFGRSKFQIGSSIAGSVILSDVTDEYGFFSTKIKTKKITISMITSSLIPDSTTINYNPHDTRCKKYDDKFLSIHKIDYNNKGLHIFAGEQVVYGNRSIDLNYLLPLAFIRAVEHNIGDRDNMLMFFGFDWTFNEANTIYFNFNLDDLVKSKIFTSFWGNKYALQLGYQKRFSKKIKVTNEITAIRPWMYTHKRMINVYSHHRRPLGFPDGSNIIENTLEIAYKPYKSIQTVLALAYAKQGSTGNNFLMNYLQVGDQKTAKAKWLDGEINYIKKVKLVVDYKFLGFNNLHTALEIYKDNDKEDTRVSIQYQIKF